MYRNTKKRSEIIDEKKDNEKRTYKNWEKHLQTLRQTQGRTKHWDKRGKQYLETSRNNKKKKEKVHGNTTTNLIRNKCPLNKEKINTHKIVSWDKQTKEYTGTLRHTGKRVYRNTKTSKQNSWYCAYEALREKWKMMHKNTKN